MIEKRGDEVILKPKKKPKFKTLNDVARYSPGTFRVRPISPTRRHGPNITNGQFWNGKPGTGDFWLSAGFERLRHGSSGGVRRS